MNALIDAFWYVLTFIRKKLSWMAMIVSFTVPVRVIVTVTISNALVSPAPPRRYPTPSLQENRTLHALHRILRGQDPYFPEVLN